MSINTFRSISFSQALFNLVSFDADHVLSRLENIIEHLYSINLNLRHGSILCLGEIIHASYIVKKGLISYGMLRIYKT